MLGSLYIYILSSKRKKCKNLLVLKLFKNKICWIKKIYITCKTNYILHSIRYYSFTCNIHFLNSTYLIFNQFKSNKFLLFFCFWIYLLLYYAFTAPLCIVQLIYYICLNKVQVKMRKWNLFQLRSFLCLISVFFTRKNITALLIWYQLGLLCESDITVDIPVTSTKRRKLYQLNFIIHGFRIKRLVLELE